MLLTITKKVLEFVKDAKEKLMDQSAREIYIELKRNLRLSINLIYYFIAIIYKLLSTFITQ